ncbi:hypothetical protein EON83_17810 [bacterium]|nr:MAG: hypothetical protein EON83_17810 [bacterium]
MITTHFQRIFLVGTFCVFAGAAFGQSTNNRNGGNRQNMAQTNTQRETMRATMRENQIRTSLTNAGFTDTTIQDPIVALAKMEQAASQGLLPKINALRTALNNNAQNNAGGNNTQGNNMNGRSVADIFADYRSAVADMQEARATAIINLDKTVSFSTNPTLEALLTMLGIIGDETGFVSNLAGQAQLPGASNGGGPNGGGPNGGGQNGGGMGNGPGGMNGGGMNGGMGGGFGGMNGGMGGGFGGGMMPPPPPDEN